MVSVVTIRSCPSLLSSIHVLILCVVTDAYTVVEVDSFGHFYLKARTGVLRDNCNPTWNESFEIDLESSTTLRIICYKQNAGGDTLLGKCVLNVSRLHSLF